MIRRICRSLRWFGALAALLLLPLPVQADDIKPEPYVEEEMAEPEPVVEAEVEEEAEPEDAGEYGHNNKTGWDTFDATCDQAGWEAATKCSDDQANFLDGQDQQQSTVATYELVKIGSLTDSGMNCQKVRETLPAITR